MGEIGIPRREFLYEIKFWEVRRIIRGYRRRDRLKHQLLAECAYASIYAMRDPKGKSVTDIFPGIFEDDDEYEAQPEMSDEDYNDLQDLMANYNAQQQQQQHPQPDSKSTEA